MSVRLIYSGIHDACLITILELGMAENAEPTYTGRMECFDKHADVREFGLMWNNQRLLVTSGIEDWTEREESALRAAGFTQ